jgi:hypothetical protein
VEDLLSVRRNCGLKILNGGLGNGLGGAEITGWRQRHFHQDKKVSQIMG